MKTVLVLDANQRSALAVTRSLGRQNVQVYTAEETPNALAGHSRFSSGHFTYPSPRIHPDKFIDALCSLVEEEHVDILLPMTELTTMLLLSHNESLPPVTMPFPDLNIVDSLANKCSLMRLAESLDIPIPRTWYVDDPNNLPCRLEELIYPIVLKPGQSWLFHENHWCRASVKFAADETEATKILASYWAFSDHPFMIQQCVEGHGAGVFAIYDKGEPLALFAHRRLREKPPSGGVSVLSESIRVDSTLGLYTRTLLENVGWHGIAMVEFKLTPEGTPYLMEINTRFWGSLQLAIDAGVDFPYKLYQLACDEQPDTTTDYKIGIRLRWLLGDLDNLYLTLRDKHCTFGQKLRAVVNFMNPSPFRTRHEINRLGDMKPFWFECKQYMQSIFK